MASPTIQFRRGAFTNLPDLLAGEPGFTTDKYDFYIGTQDAGASTNQFFGSGRYWDREDATNSAKLRLVDKDGSNYIAIGASDALAGIATYYLPNSNNGSGGDFLKLTSQSGGLYYLEWAAVPSGSFSIQGDTGTDTFTTGETLTFTGGEGIDTAVTNNTVTISAELASTSNAGVASFTSTDFSVSGTGEVSLLDEAIQDIVGGMVTGNTETLITVTYQDADGTIDFEVNNDLSLYSNATSAFITASSSNTLTNKTFDANGTGNSISNLEVADFAASGITTSGDTIATNDSDTQLPTSAAVIDYVGTQIGNIDLTITTAEGTNGTGGGGGSVSTSQTLTFAGTTNEVNVTVAGQTVTYGLPNDVTIGNNLTVTGDLFVNGNTTQVNTTSLTVEDTLVELGIVDGSAPSSDVNRDLGILFNWYDTQLRKAAVFWDDSVTRVAIAQDVTESSSVLTVATYAPVEIGSLWINDAAGQSQVIRHDGSQRVLENIVIDGGSFV